MPASDDDEFTEFVRDVEPRLRRALVALAGPEEGRDALAEALAYAWQHWARVRSMDNPAGYLYRVARSRVPRRRRAPDLPAVEPDRMPEVEPALAGALAGLPERQRVTVFLVYGCEWTHPEVADLFGVSVSTVRNHLARGLDRLRKVMEVRING